ncbi:M12 family metallopeptidase [Cesiribacter sp. SM1]|uniref:M12 family metallopeptidase n=1 Tax=Cesiribacter sp. SM1 TaxID=2861196 RepID=UPI001CD1EA43|nr:M12 family metallopeptidase [Cesiribacter sp. SM1]
METDFITTETPTIKTAGRSFCSMPATKERELDPAIPFERASLIRLNNDKWVNGTVIHYFFFKTPPLAGSEREMEVVREAFRIWKGLGIGLQFEEVFDMSEAEVRIGFMKGNGSWSYVGTQVLNIGQGDRTMNFGWDITREGEISTALHEIGHTLGFPHEHQNPNAGIEWDEEKVYSLLAGPPNNWDRQKTYHNIIRKLNPSDVQGSAWDPDSVMHYPFGPGLILKPAAYHQTGVNPSGQISEKDKDTVLKFYPPLIREDGYKLLEPFKSIPLSLKPTEQANLRIRPTETRTYNIRTFGESDVVAVLFEKRAKRLRYLTADDDSGEDRNAAIQVKLFKGVTYVLRIRVYYASKVGNTAVMLW